MVACEALRLKRLAESRIRAASGAWAMFALHEFWAAWERKDGYGKMELCEEMLRG